jgi:type II secretory pathway component PulC
MAMDKSKGWTMASLALLVLAALLALHLGLSGRGDGRGGREGADGTPVAIPEPFRWGVPDAGVWRRFRSGEPVEPPAAAGELSARYRLAGVFLILSDADRSGGENRCAILDERSSQQQFLAMEGEWIGSVRVVRVEPDFVVLSDGEREETVVLAAGTLAGQAGTPTAASADVPAILETNRFGHRIGETRWEFNRQAVLDYYQEMMDNPERLASLFLAMEADRDEEGRVAGYRLNMEAGEKEFYSLVGFQHGDVIRRVNSMRMTSQRRAEYFIGEFVQNRLGAVVIDVERNGEPKKLIYLVQ